jgi:hypothetical protein
LRALYVLKATFGWLLRYNKFTMAKRKLASAAIIVAFAIAIAIIAAVSVLNKLNATTDGEHCRKISETFKSKQPSDKTSQGSAKCTEILK